MTLLQKRDLARQQRRLEVFSETRRRLQSALRDLIPGQRVVLFGSLTQSGVFNDASDVDLALETEPCHITAERLVSELMERLDRRVDIVLLDQSRFREKIIRHGEAWTA